MILPGNPTCGSLILQKLGLSCTQHKTLLILFNFSFQTFDANDLYQGQNFNKVLSSLVTLNKVTAGKIFF